MTRRECTTKDFRDIIANASNVFNIEKRYFNLIVEINGDPSIINNYELEIYDGEEWIKLYRGYNLCEVIDVIRTSIKIELEKREKIIT